MAGGTGWRARLPGIEVAGKTGSAQVVAKARLEKTPNALELQPHGWFLCFAPAEAPTIALAVLVEHGSSGGESAAPVAREILAEWFGLAKPPPGPSLRRPGGGGLRRARDRPPAGLQRRLGAARLEPAAVLHRRRDDLLRDPLRAARGPLPASSSRFVALGLVALVVTALLDYRRLADRAMLLYGVSVVALLSTCSSSRRVRAGTQRWIVVGGFQLQPSELVKLAAAIFVAKVFSEYRQETLGLFDVALPGAAVGLLALLIAREPDLGTAACLVPLLFAVAFLAGLRMRAVAALVAALVHHRLARLAVPARLPEDPHLHLPRSLARPAWRRLPEDPVADRGGLGGPGRARASRRAARRSSATCPRATRTSSSRCSPRRWASSASWSCWPSTCSCSGGCSRWRGSRATAWARFWWPALAGGFGFQVVYNVAMVAGLVPVKGLPLPLMSYGGSSMLSSLMAVGLVLSVRMRRFAN